MNKCDRAAVLQLSQPDSTIQPPVETQPFPFARLANHSPGPDKGDMKGTLRFAKGNDQTREDM
jgi:hypothetical protein